MSKLKRCYLAVLLAALILVVASACSTTPVKHPHPAQTATLMPKLIKQKPKPRPTPTPVTHTQPTEPVQAATPYNGSACTTVVGYFPGGEAGWWYSAEQLCVPDNTAPEPTTAMQTDPPGTTIPTTIPLADCPDLAAGYGVDGSVCVYGVPGTGEYSQQCLSSYGPKFPYLVGEHCEATPYG